MAELGEWEGAGAVAAQRCGALIEHGAFDFEGLLAAATEGVRAASKYYLDCGNACLHGPADAWGCAAATRSCRARASAI
jgi:hypothetical protein